MSTKIHTVYGSKNSDSIGIGWDITTKCNFNCNYCYAMDRYADKWQKDNDISKNIKLLNSLCKMTNKNIRIEILGGEPTLSKNLFPIIETFTHKNTELHLFTNFSKDLDYWENPIFDNIYLDISMHINEVHVPHFLDKVLEVQKILSNPVRLKIMLDYKNKSHIEFQDLYINKLIELNKFIGIDLDYIVYPNSTENPRDILKNNSITFSKLYDIFSRDIYINDVKNKESILAHIDMENSLCEQNQYVFNIDGTFTDLCTNTNYTYFQMVKQIKSNNIIKCEHHFCPCFNFCENKKVFE